MKKHLKILGLEEGASQEEIEGAYNRLSKELDPANNDNLDFFVEEYKLVQEAYKELAGKESDTSKVTDVSNEFKEKSNKTPGHTSDNFSKNKDNSVTPQLPKKSNKKALLIIVIVGLIFIIPYFIFLTRVSNLENNIPTITKSSIIKQDSLDYWKAKLYKEHPDLSWEAQFEQSDRFNVKDSLVSFFIYKKILEIPYYKENFFECVYQNGINSAKYWSVYITASEKKYKANDEPVFIKISKTVWKKYRLSRKELDKLISVIGGMKVFHKEQKLVIDNKCSQCIKDYRNNYELNTIALSDFYSFISKYLKDKRNIEKSNKSVILNYNQKYKNLTAGMSKNLLNKLKVVTNKNQLIRNETINKNYNGSLNGIGVVNYSFQKKTYDSSLLSGYVKKVYSEYYKTNSLKTGSMPYDYCYGRNPYCSPPKGYEECSFIAIKASSNSDSVVIIKKNNRVYSHAYVKAGGYYKFKLGNGSFQAFFYYGKGWNPKKYIKTTNCGRILGGFVSNESLDKSEVINLYNSSITYTLYSVENGNFSPKKSNKNEAF